MVKSSVDQLTQKGALFFGLLNKKSLKTKGDEIDERHDHELLKMKKITLSN